MPKKSFSSFLPHRWVYFVVALYTFGLLYVALNTQRIFEDAGSPKLTQNTAQAPFASVLHGLYDTFLQPITAENLTLPSGEMLQFPFPSSPNGPRFQSLLGQKILVLDVDTRPLNNKGELLNSTWSSNETTLWATAGRLNHYLFAQLHGYDYKFVQMADLPGRFGTWSKVTAIRQYLPYYEFIVFMDADVIYPHPHVPLEWLFNYWDIIPENLVAMAIDPSYPINNDMRGRTLLNTGFIIAQRSPRTMELFEAWESCPTNARYNSCSTFSYDWPHEQGAFGNFLRYDFDRRDDIKSLSCSEANGCPEVTYLGCSGKLIRHYWGSKASVPGAMQESILRFFLLLLHKEFHQSYGNIFSTAFTKYMTNGTDISSIAKEDVPHSPEGGVRASTEDVGERPGTVPIDPE